MRSAGKVQTCRNGSNRHFRLASSHSVSQYWFRRDAIRQGAGWIVKRNQNVRDAYEPTPDFSDGIGSRRKMVLGIAANGDPTHQQSSHIMVPHL